MSEASNSGMIPAVMPALNEETATSPTLRFLRRLPGAAEIIVSGGGGADWTTKAAVATGGRVVLNRRCRGPQLHAGPLVAGGDVFRLVHASMCAGLRASRRVLGALANPGVMGGALAPSLDGGTQGQRLMHAVRPLAGPPRLLHGNSTIFLRRETCLALEGFRPHPSYEDVDLIAKMRRSGRFAGLREKVFTCSRRFRQKNLLRKFTRWSVLRKLCWTGATGERPGNCCAPVRRTGEF